MPAFKLYAKEVTLAYGIKQQIEGSSDISARDKLVPTFAESVEDYDFLRRINALALQSKAAHRIPRPVEKPSIWPLDGRLLSPYGKRTDPFSEEGAFHKGVDISAPTGTPVHATADGIVIFTEFESGYGRLVVVDHGGGFQTYYAHLSQFWVHAGQEVRRGELVGLVGSSGKVTAPHLHYEVRIGGSPMNPILYMTNRRRPGGTGPQGIRPILSVFGGAGFTCRTTAAGTRGSSLNVRFQRVLVKKWAITSTM